MNKYEEMKLLQENLQEFKKIMQERIENQRKKLMEDYKNVGIGDKKSLSYYFNLINSIQEENKKIQKCDEALKKLDDMEIYISRQSIEGHSDIAMQEDIEKTFKRELHSFKVENKDFLDNTFNELAYENGAESLSDDKEVEEYKEQLKNQLEEGKITEDEFEKETYGMEYFDIVDKEEREEETEKEPKIEYSPEIDKGDNSYKEFEILKIQVENYITRAKRDFEEHNSGEVEKVNADYLKEISLDYEKAEDLSKKLEGIEYYIGASTTLPPEKANKLIADKLIEFKKENFNELAEILADGHKALKSDREEYQNIVYNQEDIENPEKYVDRLKGEIDELNDELNQEGISEEKKEYIQSSIEKYQGAISDIEFLSYTNGYAKAYDNRFMEIDEKSTQELGKETISEQEDTKGKTEVEQQIIQYEKEMQKQQEARGE